MIKYCRSIRIIASFSFIIINLTALSQNDIPARLQWFADAKLGIFIHWGIYSVEGTDESWAFHNKKMSHKDYMKQIEGFTASNYRPEEWVQLIKNSGARYAVITSKHHDGVALWNTAMNGLSIPRLSPSKRDVLSPFVHALRKENIKVGLYYSLIDWSHSDYPGFLKDSSRYQIKDNPERWQSFLKFYQGQMDELMTLYNPDLWWFDGDWEHTAEEWQAEQLRNKLLAHNKNAIINGRLREFGDYETPEQNFPLTRPAAPCWELCMTTNDSWGWQPSDTAFKTPYELITIFADVVGKGGNLLLDIGPKEDGSVPERQVYLLKELEKWTKKHEEAIFGSLAGLPEGHFYGPSSLSKDSSSIYLFLPANPTGNIMIKGLFNNIKKISVVGHDSNLSWKIVGKISWSPVPGLVYIDVPSKYLDTYMTVLKVELNSPLKLYRGKGGLGL